MIKVYQPEYKTLNALHFPTPAVQEIAASFHFFPKLPTELRFTIWRMSHISRRRLITLRVTNQDMPRCREGKTESSIALSCSARFSIDQKPRKIHLLQVNRESRQVAQEQYRVPFYAELECHDSPYSSAFYDHSDTWDLFESGLEDTEAISSCQFTPHPIMWLNPEDDIIFLPKFEMKTEAFMDFINAFRMADPLGIGLLHLSFDSFCSESLTGLRALDPCAGIQQDAVDMFRESVSGLKSLWFIHLLDYGSRIGCGPLSGTRDYSIGLDRSVPIMPYTVEFDLLPRDPRPVEGTLRGKTVFCDPKASVAAWVAMEEKLGFNSGEEPESTSTPPVGLTREISHILAMAGRSGHKLQASYGDVRCARTMDLALKREQEKLNNFSRMGDYGKQILEAETEERKRNLLSAAGFWVFPGDTFDTLHLLPGYEGKLYQDLAEQQPGLGLFEL